MTSESCSIRWADEGQAELGKLISAARKGRWGQRDATLILLMARHGLRVSEAVDLGGCGRWRKNQIDRRS